ncbi:Nucleoside-diphosphate-sugar epimerase [Asanoa hainanensis]|uniref:Nucleoside-diphosphate-sugar epimerase n=1 Tax=Asanoa hainanensis TaxID=560556 RepID=A0A239MI61_9ACTN|nr:NAD-dependent epimerase/dehydratase family protein [Asanoa hainanensis]SNT41913.1 Nucleoside-diphosphate-sugar epimerase [Asanoa hainanensis]
MERVLVTGGTGFVAGWCIAGLLDRGYAVRTTVRDSRRAASGDLTRAADLGMKRQPARDLRAAIDNPSQAVDGDSAQPAGSNRIQAASDRFETVTADLTRDEGWDAAAADCAYVLHVASPLGVAGDSLIGPARDGALRVLRAATRAGVRRVVLTSSTAATTPADPRGVSDETVWTDPEDPNLNPYRRSKLLAERAAWDFMATHGGDTELTTVLPAAVFGPLRSPGNAGSVDVIARLLAGRPPVLPRFGFSIVDVRDLADLHIRAMTAPAAAGERFIGAGEFRWLAEIAAVLRGHLGAYASKVPTRPVPDGVVRALARLVPALRPLTPLLGRDLTFSSAKAQKLLGFTPRPATETIVDCARSLTTPNGRA